MGLRNGMRMRRTYKCQASAYSRLAKLLFTRNLCSATLIERCNHPVQSTLPVHRRSVPPIQERSSCRASREREDRGTQGEETYVVPSSETRKASISVPSTSTSRLRARDVDATLMGKLRQTRANSFTFHSGRFRPNSVAHRGMVRRRGDTVKKVLRIRCSLVNCSSLTDPAV